MFLVRHLGGGGAIVSCTMMARRLMARRSAFSIIFRFFRGKREICITYGRGDTGIIDLTQQTRYLGLLSSIFFCALFCPFRIIACGVFASLCRLASLGSCRRAWRGAFVHAILFWSLLGGGYVYRVCHLQEDSRERPGSSKLVVSLCLAPCATETCHLRAPCPSHQRPSVPQLRTVQS